MLGLGSRTTRSVIESEEELITRLKAGDERVAEALFRSLYGTLCRFAHQRISSRQDVEDIVENAFEQLWSSRRNLDPSRSVRSYLFKIVQNKCIDYLRQNGKEFITFEEERAHAVSNANPIHDTVHSELAVAVNAAIQHLPSKCKEIFTLSRQHGLTQPEIAEVLGISQKTVENQIGRAIKLLRKRLKNYLA